MALPKIEHPTFDVNLPSTNQTIKCRPFLVKEEKILLTALQTEDSAEIINSIKQVINNCIVTEGVDIEVLPTLDIELLFIKIRARSVNNVIKLAYRDNEDNKRYEVEVNLDEVEIKTDDTHTNKIVINDKMGFFMKYPTADINAKIKDTDSEAELFFDILKNCIEKIYVEEEEYSAADSTPEELDEFLEGLDVKTFTKIQEFFATAPKLHYEVKYTNSLGNERVIVLSTLNDFFTLG